MCLFPALTVDGGKLHAINHPQPLTPTDNHRTGRRCRRIMVGHRQCGYSPPFSRGDQLFNSHGAIGNFGVARRSLDTLTPPNKLTAPTAELPTQKKKAPDGAPRSESPAFRSTHRNAGERFLSQVTNKSLSVNPQTSHRLSYIIIHLVLRKDKPPLGKTRISAILLSFHRDLRGVNCVFSQKFSFSAAR